MALMAPSHRIVAVTACILVLFVLLYNQPTLDLVRLRPVPLVSSSGNADARPVQERLRNMIPHPNAPPTSRLHYLVPASHSGVQLCYNLVSSAANRYPVPLLLGWNATGEFNAAETHLAKLRSLKRYLDALPPQEDSDLVLMVDGFDVMHQLPPDVVIERYFEIANKADAHLADRLSLSIDEARRRNLRQTIFWGPDKICFPGDHRAPRCWAVPPSTLGPHAFGPKSGSGDMTFADPRWLNSGTVIGPVDDVRKLINATMDEIAATHDPEYELSESDQYYIANVWSRQEYWRSKLAAGGGDVVGGPKDRIVPDMGPDAEAAELHVAIEYESALFQTKAAYDPFLGHVQFNESGLTATMDTDFLGLGDDFTPFSMEMPDNVHKALTALYDSVPEAHVGQLASDWIRTVNLGVNYVTKHIYGLWHCTGSKSPIDGEYTTFWWYPFARSLLKAAVKSSQAGDAISSRPLDGRRWVAKTAYPKDGTLRDEYGGAWTDEDEGGKFVPWAVLCGAHDEVLFRGEPAPAS